MKNFLLFRRMITPTLVQIFFWVGLVICFISGGNAMSQGQWLDGLQTIILGVILLRVVCEILILFFRMNDNLTEIKNNSKNK